MFAVDQTIEMSDSLLTRKDSVLPTVHSKHHMVPSDLKAKQESVPDDAIQLLVILILLCLWQLVAIVT